MNFFFRRALAGRAIMSDTPDDAIRPETPHRSMQFLNAILEDDLPSARALFDATPSGEARAMAANAMIALASLALLSGMQKVLPFCCDLADAIFDSDGSLLDQLAKNPDPQAVECARLILPHGDWRSRDWASHSKPCRALFVAARNGHADMLRVLLGALDPTATDGSGKWSAFHHAVAGGQLEAAQILAPVSDVAAQTDGGLDALSLAARLGVAEVIPFLLSLGAFNPLAANQEGKTPLLLAVERAFISGCLDAVAALAPVSDIFHKDRSGNDAVGWMPSFGEVGLDALLEKRPIEDIREVQKRFEPKHMPRAHARLEQADLARVLAQDLPTDAAQAPPKRMPRAL